ncbi:MAG: glycogen synthase GlgA [Clostridia bacterium]|nr:glycogen synthase GlgA [Clostridia bacterium]
MKILYAGSEAFPFIATGGLGDVLGSLPVSVARLSPDNDVRVVIPYYSSISPKFSEKMTFVTSFEVHLAWRCQLTEIWQYVYNDVTFYFVKNDYYFARGKLYGEYDDGERFAFFSMAVVDMLDKVDFIPDILHANDWQTALSVVYLKKKYHYHETKAIYTIHNIEYQGKFPEAILGDVFSLRIEDLRDVEYDGCINLTKGAIVCCDELTTVSSRYSEEIRLPYYAHGLSEVITMYSFKTCGIVNGIDTVYYDPMTDPLMEGKHFSANYHTFAGKASNKAALQRKLGLPEEPDKPLIAMVTRLVSHKGLDLVRAIIGEVLQGESQFVILGTGDEDYEYFFRKLEEYYPDKVRALIKFDKELSKQIYAGADIFLMPSQAEPCGLSQMIACRYGTVPVVRQTGGLYDTIKAFDPTTGEGNGFNFYAFHPYEMKDAIGRALAAYSDKNVWHKIVKNAMNSDFSWRASAEKYQELYKSLF